MPADPSAAWDSGNIARSNAEKGRYAPEFEQSTRRFPAPRTILRRVEVLAAVHAKYGTAGLFECDPNKVALHYYGMRANCTRKTRTSRILAATLEDFRAWCTVTANQGD